MLAVCSVLSAGAALVAAEDNDPRPYPDGMRWGSTWPRIGVRLEEDDEPPAPRFVVYPETPPPPQADTLYSRKTLSGNLDDKTYKGLLYVVEGAEHFSILPPLDGCGNGLFTPQRTSAGRCVVATNAGFFNTKTSECHGTIVSDGKAVHQSDELNVSFGVLQNGTIVVGFLTEEEKKDFRFRNLVNGVVWLVRNGSRYVDESIRREFGVNPGLKPQETGCESPDNCRFRDVKAPRLALGHDAAGKILILAVDGAPGFATKYGWSVPRTGVDLHEMADLMIQAGAVNAVNLDGGGSVSVFEHGVLVNNPTDACGDTGRGDLELPLRQACPRKVSSILCVHAGTRTPRNPPVPPGAPQATSRKIFTLALIAACVVGLANFVLFSAKWALSGGICCGSGSDGCGDTSSANQVAGSSVLPVHGKRVGIKKLRKKRGERREVPVPHSGLEFEMYNLPATCYDSDTPPHRPPPSLSHHVHLPQGQQEREQPVDSCFPGTLHCNNIISSVNASYNSTPRDDVTTKV